MEACAACACCIFGLLVLQAIIMIVLAAAVHMPVFQIQDFYIPALDTRLPTFNSTTTANPTFIFFDLELKNVMEAIGVHYGDIHLSFYYGSTNTSTTSIANCSLARFYQGARSTAHRRKLVETGGSVSWLDAFAAVSNASTVVFRLELSTRVKLKYSFDRRSKLLLRGGYVEVNRFGEKVQKKGIKLKSLK